MRRGTAKEGKARAGAIERKGKARQGKTREEKEAKQGKRKERKRINRSRREDMGSGHQKKEKGVLKGQTLLTFA